MRWFYCFAFFFSIYAQEESLFARSQEAEPVKEYPDFWSTGPLINYPGDIVEMGHVAIQPYISWFQCRGFYDSDWDFRAEKIFNSVVFQPYFRTGICPRVEIDLFPSLSYNQTEGAGKWVFGDFPVWLSAMLWDAGDYFPAALLQTFVNFPTGKYQKLKEAKLETDLGGTGSWEPGVGLTLYKAFHLWDAHYLALTYFVGYYFETSVHVKGLNAYGGDEMTVGKVRPGNVFDTILSFEYSFTQNWLFSIDADYEHGDRTKFSGVTEEPVGGPSYEQFSIVPALEYMWDENSGINFGSWFTVAGKNVKQYNSLVVSIYLYR